MNTHLHHYDLNYTVQAAELFQRTSPRFHPRFPSVSALSTPLLAALSTVDPHRHATRRLGRRVLQRTCRSRDRHHTQSRLREVRREVCRQRQCACEVPALRHCRSRQRGHRTAQVFQVRQPDEALIPVDTGEEDDNLWLTAQQC
jgi:hypothetical protein